MFTLNYTSYAGGSKSGVHLVKRLVCTTTDEDRVLVWYQIGAERPAYGT